MITVKAKYLSRRTRDGIVVIYTELIVEGHASNGDMDSIKCCAGVTAVLLGFAKIVSGAHDYVKLDKGCFYYRLWDTKCNEKETRYALDLVINQLYEIYKTYPSLFKKFELIEIAKENENGN